MPLTEVYDSKNPALPNLPIVILQYQEDGCNRSDSDVYDDDDDNGNDSSDSEEDKTDTRKPREQQLPTFKSVSGEITNPKTSKPYLSIKDRRAAAPFTSRLSADEGISPLTSRIPKKLTIKTPEQVRTPTRNNNHRSNNTSSSSLSSSPEISQNQQPDDSIFSPLTSLFRRSNRNQRGSRFSNIYKSSKSAPETPPPPLALAALNNTKGKFVRRAGWEPGVNVDMLDVPGDFDNPLGCQVTIVDYEQSRHKLWRMEVHDESDRPELYNLLKNRPSWSKVRWINVSGRRQEAVKEIGSFHELHRLAIEDMVFGEGRRTKAEKYPTHTFCCLPLFKCMRYVRPRIIQNKRNLLTPWRHTHRKSFAEFREHERRTSVSTAANFFKNYHSTTDGITERTQELTNQYEEGEDDIYYTSGSSSPPMNINNNNNGIMTLSRKIAKQNPESIYKWHNPETDEHVGAMYLEARRPLAAKGKALGIEQVYLFLTNDGTVISFFDKGADRVETPVLSRIGTDSTILRESSDPSMLLQAVIDCIVDEINPIIGEYRQKLDELQIAAVMNPTMGHTQDLHLINAELTILRNTIVPITSLINSLRDHSGSVTSDPTGNPLSEEVESEAAVGEVKAFVGHAKNINTNISDLASMYLADVSDHTMTHTQDLDVMRNNAKSMTELIFNTISIQSSDAVRLLSLVTVVFLPLSFLTGYYGMNFTDFDTLNNNTGFYWSIAVPFCVAMTSLLMWQWVIDKIRNTKNDIVRFWRAWNDERRDYSKYKKRRDEQKRKMKEKQKRKSMSQIV